MFEAQQVQHGGVEIAKVQRVFYEVVLKFARLAENSTAARHPHAETSADDLDRNCLGKILPASNE